MTQQILDEFTGARTKSGKPMSRQQIYMMRKRKIGRCWICNKKKLKNKWFCSEHVKKQRVLNRESMRRRLGFTKRYLNAQSYNE